MSTKRRLRFYGVDAAKYFGADSVHALLNDDDPWEEVMAVGAVEKGQFRVFELIDSVRAIDLISNSVAHYAAKTGRLRVLKWLQERQSLDLRAEDDIFRTVVESAAMGGHTVVLQWFYEEGLLDSELLLASGDAWIVAACYGHLSVLQWAHSTFGGVLSTIDSKRSLASHSVRHLHVLQWLHSIGQMELDRADPSVGWNLAHLAAHDGHLEVLQWLHSLGSASFEEVDFHGWNVALILAEHNNLKALQWTYAVKALDGRKTEKTKRWNIAHVAARGGHFALLQWLHSIGMLDVNALDAHGSSLAHLASNDGHFNIVRWLYEANLWRPDPIVSFSAASRGSKSTLIWLHSINALDINENDKQGKNVAHLAARAGSVSILQWLHSLDLLDARNEGWYVEHFLAHYGRIEALKTYHAQGKLSPHVLTHAGETIAHLASKNGCFQVMEWLRSMRLVDETATTKDGFTAAQLSPMAPK